MHSFITPQPPDLPPSPDTLIIIPDTSVGIIEVRQVQAFLAKKPIQSPQNTVIIESAHLLTLPAQHAFLKTLEEPPGNSRIYLVTNHPDLLLPTILSRCEIQLTTDNPHPTTADTAAYAALFSKLVSAPGVGERLQIIEEQKFDRDSALAFIDSLEHFLHTQIQSTSQLSIVDYQLIVDARKYLKANCNVRLTLDHFALSLTPVG